MAKLYRNKVTKGDPAYLRNKLSEVRVIIIDEISMVGNLLLL